MSYAPGDTLASGKIIVGNASGIASPVTPTGDITIDNTGATALGALKVSTTMLQANAVTSAKLDVQTVQFQSTPLSSAQILALNTTPIVVVTAPGAGLMAVFLDGLLTIRQAGTDYATAHNVTLNYVLAGSGQTASTTLTNPFTTGGGTTNRVITLKQITTDITETTNVATAFTNQPIVIKASANPTVGNHTAVFYAWFAVITV